MAEVIFNYEGTEIKIQCNMDDKIHNIINKFYHFKYKALIPY